MASATGDYVPVSQFFQNRSVFVTGGTGFMGKVLVEKLLRSCPGIKNIYLLMRPKRGQDIDTRLNELINAPVSISITLLFLKSFKFEVIRNLLRYPPLPFFKVFKLLRLRDPQYCYCSIEMLQHILFQSNFVEAILLIILSLIQLFNPTISYKYAI